MPNTLLAAGCVAPASHRGAPRYPSQHGSDPQAGTDRVRSLQRRAPDVVRRAGRSPSDAAHADRRRTAARAVPLPTAEARARHRRPGAAGHPARGARPLLRPATLLLAGRALRAGGPADVPRGVRRDQLPRPHPRHGALGRGGRARGDPGRQRARRRPSRARHRLEPRRDLLGAGRGRRHRPADRLPDRRGVAVRRLPGAADRAAAPDPRPGQRRHRDPASTG